MVIAGLCIILCGIILFLLLNGVDPRLYFDPPTIMLMICAFSSSQLFGFTIEPFERGIKYLFKPKIEISEVDLNDSIHAFYKFYKAIIYMGIIGFFIGATLTLMNLDDKTAVGPGMSTALISLIYSIFFAFIIVLPLITALNNSKMIYNKDNNQFHMEYIVFTISAIITPFIFIVLCIIFAKGRFKDLIFFPDIVAYIFFFTGSLVMSKSLRPFYEGIQIVSSKTFTVDENNKKIIIKTYDFLIKNAIATGFLLFFINMVVSMIKLIEAKEIFYKLGQIMVPISYGLIIGLMILYPIKKHIEHMDSTISD